MAKKPVPLEHTLGIGFIVTFGMTLLVTAGIAPLGQASVTCTPPSQCEAIAGELEELIRLAVIATVAAITVALVCAKLWANDRQRAGTMIEEGDE